MKAVTVAPCTNPHKHLRPYTPLCLIQLTPRKRQPELTMASYAQ